MGYLKRWWVLLLCGVVLCFFGGYAAAENTGNQRRAEMKPITVIIDAGHGGEDSGAVGVNGALEKDLNKTIADRLYTLLSEAGVPAVLTRTEDRLLYTEAENIRGMRKACDLKNRLKIAEQYPDAVLVSIHMNTFGQSKYSGLQVWYGGQSEEAKLLAREIQSDVQKHLQPQNKRAVKAADKGIWLLHNATCPAVLVECGFLSNPEECALLCQENYQKELSFRIFCAIMKYSGRPLPEAMP